ncbi:MAG: ATP-binding protein [Jatrophihabitantaceae bacterium]
MIVTQAIRSMSTNPGGVVDPADLIGRERELERLQRSVNTGGTKMLGDRRMGKTSLLRALGSSLNEAGHTVIRISAESKDPEKFSRDLVTEMRRNRVLREHVRRWEAELGGELKVNVGVGGLTLQGHAARLRVNVEQDLFRACVDACHHLKPYRLVFIFDEITALASRLGRLVPGGPEEFLRSLRVPRQELSGISMIFAGSVGLHHVLSEQSPVNDLDPVTVGPLSQSDALYLARCLLRGIGVPEADDLPVATSIVEQTCAIPFYIHRLVQDLAERGANKLTSWRWSMTHCVMTGGRCSTTVTGFPGTTATMRSW